ncbi:hypothetical protein T01_9940 [Trichinella spiralis]|uniref:Uncharacterized protein n=1 Tax=Trichinella spiralis TaxID=6334 RepID=A0A0V1B4K2_TRISP|nr:hypothetical protein T01_9940 [Trichinella spiralis]
MTIILHLIKPLWEEIISSPPTKLCCLLVSGILFFGIPMNVRLLISYCQSKESVKHFYNCLKNVFTGSIVQ